MTIVEDNILQNKEFLNWYESIITNGYKAEYSLEELQKLINNIVNWYEIKYPEKEFEYYKGISYTNFEDIKRISNIMTLRQLLYRLTDEQLSLIECEYKGKGYGKYKTLENNKVKWRYSIFMHINKIQNNHIPSYYSIEADAITGKILNSQDFYKYTNNKKDITLEYLFTILNKYSNELDLTELKECIFNYNCDIELRNKILELVALELLYSNNTTKENGYKRAKRYINEFNKKLGLNLPTIDTIINKYYSNDEKENKKLIRNNKNTNS